MFISKLLKFILFISCIGIVVSCNSLNDSFDVNTTTFNDNSIDLSNALDKARLFISEVSSNVTRANELEIRDYNIIYGIDKSNATHEKIPMHYVINFKPEGYAIIGADNRKNDVFMISENGEIDLNDTITNWELKRLINALPKEIVETRVVNPGEITPTLKVTKLVEPMVPQIFRKANQLTYNYYVRNLCHVPGDTTYTKTMYYENTPVGCVPWSAFQAMSIFKSPSKITAKLRGSNNSKMTYTFDWSKMISPTSKSDTLSICRFIEILGRDEFYRVFYEQNSSSSNSQYHKSVFEDLGFNYLSYCKFSPEIAINELRLQNKPVLISGSPLNSWSGHSWIIDGLCSFENPITVTGDRISYYFHFVWGNSKGGDGYYKYDIVNEAFGSKAQYTDSGENGNMLDQYCGITMYYGF